MMSSVPSKEPNDFPEISEFINSRPVGVLAQDKSRTEEIVRQASERDAKGLMELGSNGFHTAVANALLKSGRHDTEVVKYTTSLWSTATSPWYVRSGGGESRHERRDMFAGSALLLDGMAKIDRAALNASFQPIVQQLSNAEFRKSIAKEYPIEFALVMKAAAQSEFGCEVFGVKRRGNDLPLYGRDELRLMLQASKESNDPELRAKVFLAASSQLAEDRKAGKATDAPTLTAMTEMLRHDPAGLIDRVRDIDQHGAGFRAYTRAALETDSGSGDLADITRKLQGVDGKQFSTLAERSKAILEYLSSEKGQISSDEKMRNLGYFSGAVFASIDEETSDSKKRVEKFVRYCNDVIIAIPGAHPAMGTVKALGMELEHYIGEKIVDKLISSASERRSSFEKIVLPMDPDSGRPIDKEPYTRMRGQFDAGLDRGYGRAWRNPDRAEIAPTEEAIQRFAQSGSIDDRGEGTAIGHGVNVETARDSVGRG